MFGGESDPSVNQYLDVRSLNAPENMRPAQSSSAEAKHKCQQHWSCHSSCKLPVWDDVLPLCIRPDIPPEPERTTAAVLLIFAVFLIVMTDLELVGPQRCSLCVLQEAVVQAAVEGAGVVENQAAIMVHKDRVQFAVGTRTLEVSKGGVPVLDHTCTWKEEQLQVRSQSLMCDSHTETEIKDKSGDDVFLAVINLIEIQIKLTDESFLRTPREAVIRWNKVNWIAQVGRCVALLYWPAFSPSPQSKVSSNSGWPLTLQVGATVKAALPGLAEAARRAVSVNHLFNILNLHRK